MKLVKSFRGFVWKVLHWISPALEHQVSKRVSKTCWDNWSYRTKVARACPDNAFIPRVADAGKITDGFQIMHNGIRVAVGSYYGKDSSTLLKKNRGVHEPQEERLFQEVLKVLLPGSLILELGAYWAFYSIWFCKTVSKGQAYLVEPVTENYQMGLKNFQANGAQGHFTQALVGASSGMSENGTPIICVDDFVADHRLRQVAILHSDIQGQELEMLKGAHRTLQAGHVLFCFISTHSEQLHQACEACLTQHGFQTVASVPPCESYSVDGILVSRAARAPAVPAFELSRKPKHL